MQKVHTINLGGIIFQIEEDAFEKLKTYLASIRAHFKNQAEGKEIADDIEYRLAEMLQQNTGKNLVKLADVDHIINIMGQPKDFAEGETDEKTADIKTQNLYSEKTKRKFFRNTDERVVGGVCSGIAAYFDIEAWIVRVLFLVTIFLFGGSFWLYLLLWIAVPKTKTTADRLAMKGEKPTIDNIVKNVEDRYKDLSQGTFSSFFKQLMGFIEAIVKIFVRFFRKIAGALIIFIAAVLIFGIFVSYQLGPENSSFNINGNSFGIMHLTKVFFASTSDVNIFKLATLLAAGLPMIYLLLLGLLIFGSTIKINKYIHLGAFLVWIASLIGCGYLGLKTAYEFSSEETSVQVMPLDTTTTETLEIVPFESIANTGNNSIKIVTDDAGFILSDSGLYISAVKLRIEKSKTNETELVYEASARGNNKYEATNNIKNIQYKFSKVDNKLLLDDFYRIKAGAMWRAQTVKIILKLPENQKIRFDPFIERLSVNIEDEAMDYDENDLGGKTLQMTSEGLKCLDCSDDPSETKDEDEDEFL